MGTELIPGDVQSIDLREALEERYLAYALSTIMDRALPDARDGLKPVHRRLLFAMRQLRLDPGSGFKKSARVVGDVIGKYHPHGDQAVYDALVRLAQDFAVRYPLIEGQGNFGNVDGDNAAAMRYTEARLTEVSRLLLDGIDENAVDFRDTYDGEEREPVVLPAAFPNLLANGASGIAVGMATSIPPHNAAELCDAALYLIKHPNAGVEKLAEMVPGPDFPTGGIIVDEHSTIVEAYRTGRGGFRVRARWEVEQQARGAFHLVVTEIPYQVQKSRLIERIADLLQARKLPLLADVRDESAEDIRIVLEPRTRTTDPVLLMESLFRLTDMETRISLNMNVLSGGLVPQVLPLAGMLREWLDHRQRVLVRRSEYRLEKIRDRLEVLGGYLVAYANLDEVIQIIREEDDAKMALMTRFDLSEAQANAILNIRLRSLRRLEEIEIRKENGMLAEEMGQIRELLADQERRWKTIAWQIREVRKTFGDQTGIGRRRTSFGATPEHLTIDLETAMIERESITVIVSRLGWIRAMKGHLTDFAGLSFKAGDELHAAFHAETTDKLLVFTTGGRFYTIGADTLPGGKGQGEPIRLISDLGDGEDVVTVFAHDPDRKLLLVATDGRGFVVAESDLLANTRKGKQVMIVTAPAEAKLCVAAKGDYVAIVGENRKLLAFPLSEVPGLPRGKGVRLQRYRDGGVSDARVFEGAAGLTWLDSSGRTFTRSADELKEWLGSRAQAGRLPPPGFPRANRFGTLAIP